MQHHGLRAAIPHLVAIGALTFLVVVLTAAVADDIKIMGLTETHPASVDSHSSRTYYTGSCQKKPGVPGLPPASDRRQQSRHDALGSQGTRGDRPGPARSTKPRPFHPESSAAHV